MTICARLNRSVLWAGLAVLVAGSGLILGSGPATASSGPGAAVTWSAQHPPRVPDPFGGLSGISCTSPGFCLGVNPDDELTAVWNGQSWRKQPPPANFTPAAGPAAVSCVSPTYCVAAGITGATQPVIDVWNGTTWTAQSTPVQGDVGYLTGVSCVSASACLAVGQSFEQHAQWVMSWNGQQWSLLANPRPTWYVGLNAVSCSSASACTVAGKRVIEIRGPNRVRKRYAALIERWNGSHLVVQHFAQPRGTVTAVSCPARDGCIAVGKTGHAQSQYIESWNGTTWQAMTSPAGTADDTLSAVSCAAVTGCTAVGYEPSDGSTGEAAVAEQLTGSTWSVQQVPTPAGSALSELSTVSCPAAADCLAAGQYTSQSGYAVSLGEQWNGTTWARLAAPNAAGTPGASVFTGVSCAQTSSCTALGEFISSGNEDIPMAATWSGTGWAAHDPLSPQPPGYEVLAEQGGISCPAAGTCAAVGMYGGEAPWAGTWNGTKWTTVTPALPSYASLTGISCTSATFCIAVGQAIQSGPDIPLAYRWNGTAWTSMTLPAAVGPLAAVSCTSPTSCVAVDAGSSWAAAWNGTSWKAMPTSGKELALRAVSCSSAVACTAVGYSDAAGTAVIERWDGTSWTTQQPAAPPSGDSSPQLLGVSCASATACTTVGYSQNADRHDEPLIQAWDGTRWTVEQAAATGSGFLLSVSCTSPAVCTAAGGTGLGLGETPVKPLAERST